MSSSSLEHLFLHFLATGDETALEQLLRRASPALRRLARRLGADADDCEDLIQETIVAAIDAAERYDPARPLLPWLKGILTFRAAKLARGRFRRRRLHAELGDRDPDATPTSGTAPVDGAARAELDDDVHAAIARLPAAYQAAVQEFVLRGRSPVEIAQQLNATRATVRVRLHRGLRRLRELLARWSGAVLALLLGRTAAAASARALRPGSLRATAIVGAAAALVGAVLLAFARPRDAAAPLDATAAVAADRAVVAGAAADGAEAGAATATVRGAADPPPVAVAAPFTVAVVDAAGRPVPGVGLTLTHPDGRDPVLHRRRAVSDATGRATWTGLTAPVCSIATDRGVERTFHRAGRPGGDGAPAAPNATAATDTNDPASAPDAGSTANPVHRLVVPAGIVVRGRVLEPDGEPVAGASIWLGSDRDGPWRGDDVARSDANGRFELAHVPDGAFVAARHTTLARSEVVRATGDDDVELRLPAPGGTAVVHVLDADGAPVANALVFVGEAMDATPLWLAQGAAPWRAPPFELRSDVAGTVRTAALAPGRVPFFVRAAGAIPCSGWLDIVAGRAAVATVHLQRAAALRGVVTDARGAALAGAEVVLRTHEPLHSVDLRADAAGGFVFDCVPPGPVDVAARAPGCAPAVHTVDVAPGTIGALELVLPAARVVRGRVQLPGAGAGAAAGGVVRASWPPSALQDSPVLAPLAADGTFALPAAAAGRPRLALRCGAEPAWRDVGAHVQWRGDDATIVLPADFAANAALHGVLTTADGAPLAGARLFVRAAAGEWAELGRTGDDGSYALGPLPAGACTLFAETTHAGLPSLAWDGIDLQPAARTRFDAAAPACGAVDVELVRADGEALGDLAVTLVDAPRHRRAAVASAPRFRQVLAPGDYTLNVMGSRVRWVDRVPVRVTAGATTAVRLELAPAARYTLALTGLPSPRAGATGARVVLRERDGAWSSVFTLLPDAPLRLAAMLAPGRYDLELELDLATAGGDTADSANAGRGDRAHALAGAAHWSGTFACSGDPHEARALLLQLAPR